MEQRLTVITLGVRDVARARLFYEALGWRPAVVKGSMVYFEVGTTALALYAREDLAVDAAMPAAAPPPRGQHPGVTLSHNARTEAEVADVLAAASAAGGRVIKPAGRAAWGGWHGYFADLDGHVWEVCFNPRASLDADGRLRIGG